MKLPVGHEIGFNAHFGPLPIIAGRARTRTEF
jgi:hypothetical protein